RLTLFWQNTGGRLGEREVRIAARDGTGAILKEWRGDPVDGTYPTTAWKPSEVVRDTWDLVLPADQPGGAVEIAVAMTPVATAPSQYVRMAPLTVQAIERRKVLPAGLSGMAGGFDGGAELAGVELKSARARAGDALDLTLYWRAASQIPADDVVTL